MADLPNTPIAVVPTEAPADPEYPSLGGITVADLVGPFAANRQPTQLATRADTLKDRVNQIIADLIFLETGGPGSMNAFLPRDGGQAMAGDLDMGSNAITSLAAPSIGTDAANKNYVDGLAVAGADGYFGEIKWVRYASTPTTHIDVEFCRVLDTTGTAVLAPANNSLIDSTTTGAGALDTGTRASSTWYYIWAIGDSTGANPDEVLLSLSPGAPFGAGAAGTPSGVSPVMPGGYDLYRRIGAIRTDGSNNFISARKIHGVTWYEDASTTSVHSGAFSSVTYTPLALAAYVPPIAERAILAMYGSTASSSPGYVDLRSGSTSPTAARTIRTQQGVAGTTNNHDFSHEHLVLEVSATQTVDWLSSTSGHISTVEVYVEGFVEDMKHST